MPSIRGGHRRGWHIAPGPGGLSYETNMGGLAQRQQLHVCLFVDSRLLPNGTIRLPIHVGWMKVPSRPAQGLEGTFYIGLCRVDHES